jgi:hypothetical protein
VAGVVRQGTAGPGPPTWPRDPRSGVWLMRRPGIRPLVVKA